MAFLLWAYISRYLKFKLIMVSSCCESFPSILCHYWILFLGEWIEEVIVILLPCMSCFLCVSHSSYSETGRWYGCLCCETSMQVCQGTCFEEWTPCEYIYQVYLSFDDVIALYWRNGLWNLHLVSSHLYPSQSPYYIAVQRPLKKCHGWRDFSIPITWN